jgi:hypothetical protein
MTLKRDAQTKNTPARAIEAQSGVSPTSGQAEREPIILTTSVISKPAAGEEQPTLVGNRAADRGAADGTTAFFQIATQANAIVYVIDRSASTGLNGCLASAKRELLTSLERLPCTSRFQIVVYNRTAQVLRINGCSGLVYATSENKRFVALLLEEIPAEGGTEHVRALRQALALGPEVIFFLTDAADLRAEQIQAVTSLNRGRCVIHAIELGRGSASSGELPLYALARLNQGCYKSFSGAP